MVDGRAHVVIDAAARNTAEYAEGMIVGVEQHLMQASFDRGHNLCGLERLRGEDSIAAMCRLERIAESLYYSLSKEYLGAGTMRLAGDTSRSATSDEVSALRMQSRLLKKA